MPALDPFGSNSASGDPNINTQTFLGLTVVDFDVNTTFDSQGGTATIKLIQDAGEVLTDPVTSGRPVITSPQVFQLKKASGTLAFEFRGILSSLRREITAGGPKTYTAVLSSPAVLLSAVSLITKDYAGDGDATEAISPNTATSLDFGHKNDSYTGSNIYNLLNAFGCFENDDNGLATISPIGFGISQINDDGMRVQALAYTIDRLVNRGESVQLGGNIVYGASTYAGASPYYYGFDINGFINQISAYIPDDYRTTATNLMEFVDELASETNHIYFLELVQPTGTFSVTQTYGGTVAGGHIQVVTQNRNIASPGNPYALSKAVIQSEIADKGATGVHPGTDGGGLLPIDFPWVSGEANASSPYGGQFPVEDITVADQIYRSLNNQIGVEMSDNAVTGKMIVGGFQSRINSVPIGTPGTPYIYQYWGEIRFISKYGTISDAQDNSARSIPVVTKVLDPNDMVDFVMIDLQDAFGNTDITGFMRKGVYLASMLEIRYAMAGLGEWYDFMVGFKPVKIRALETYFGAVVNKSKEMFFNDDGTLTYAGKAFTLNALGTLSNFNTRGNATSFTRVDCSNPSLGMINMEIDAFIQKLHGNVKRVGDENYGKKWVVTLPAFTTKIDGGNESVIGDFIRSWEISSDAFLDPPSFAAAEAPQSPVFVENGRTSAFVNYDSNATSFTLNPHTSLGVANYGGGAGSLDFSEYSQSKFAYSDISSTQIFHFKPESVDNEYLFLPTNYFTVYDRTNFTNLGITNLIGIQSFTFNTLVDTIFAFNIADNGIGMFPYGVVTTKRVYLPYGDTTTMGYNYTNIDHLWENTVGSLCAASQETEKSVTDSSNISMFPFPATVPPRRIGIPQQSNRFIYGPWVTNSITVGYAGKVEYEQDTNLVPENYIIPTSITIGGVSISLTSGLAGLDIVGQAKADTIEDFDYLFTEEGTITLPGLPLITRIGQVLISQGPLVSDISVGFGVDGIETTYRFATYVPKLGRTNNDIIRKITKLGKRIKSIGNLVN